jgi:hypothetical protein
MRQLTTVPKAISSHPTQQCPKASSVVGINMVHQIQKGLPEPGDYRLRSWRDVVGLLMALIGLVLVVGMTLTM